MLYVIDANRRQVLACPFGGAGPIDVGLAVLCFGTELCPALERPRGLTLAVDGTPSIHLTTNSGASAHFSLGRSGWEKETRRFRPDWQIRNPREEATQEGFILKGSTGRFEVVELASGTVVAQGEQRDPTSWQKVTPIRALTPGIVHEVRSTNEERGVRFVPTLRYGRSLDSAELEFGCGRAVCMSFPTPSITVGITIPYSIPPGLIVPEEIEIALAFGFRDAGGNDPIERTPDAVLLRPQDSLTLSLKTGGRRQGYLTHMLAAPSHPTAGDEVILFQIAAVGSSARTDVFGTRLQRPKR